MAVYQKANELTADGIVGGLTMAAIEKSVQAIVKPSDPIVKPKVEEIRMSNQVQQRLKRLTKSFYQTPLKTVQSPENG